MVVRGIDLRGMHMQHFACFHCRKSFKQRGSEGDASILPVVVPARDFPCPTCGVSMSEMGRDFEAPPVRDRLAWLSVEVLHSFGIIFEPSINGPGFRPRKLRDLTAFLIEKGHDSKLVLGRIAVIRRLRRQAGKKLGG